MDSSTPQTVRPPAANVLARIRSVLPSLQPSDTRVATAILDLPEDVVYQSVSEVAESAGTSTATVVRCAQKLGFRGFHDLKLALARELSTFDVAADESARTVDPRLATLAQVAAVGAMTVGEVAALVDPAAFEAVVDAISNATRVLFCGVGTSAPLAQDAAYRFSSIGVTADAPPDVHVQHVRAALLEPGSVCVAISHTGSTQETLAAVASAQAAGALRVAITSFARSPLTESVDHVILAGTREVSFQLEAMASRLAHLAILDALLVSVAARDDARSQRALSVYSDVLSRHRF